MTDSEKLEADKQTIRNVMKYRSGEGLMNTVYMGSIAKAGMYRALGINYGRDSFEPALQQATCEQVNRLLEKADHYIKYMRANPVTNCPCCGQIMSVKKEISK